MSILKSRRSLILFVCLLPLTVFAAKPKKALTVQDLMKFKEIHHPVISDDGAWVAYAAQPDRGDGEVIVRATKGKKEFAIERGNKPVISSDSRWVVAEMLPKAVDEEKAKDDKKKPKKGLALLDTESGDVLQFDQVESFLLSKDSRWLAIKKFDEIENKNKKKDMKVGSEILLRELDTQRETAFCFVHSFAFDSTSRFLAYSVVDTTGSQNGLYCVDLKSESLSPKVVDFQKDGLYSHLAWNKEGLLAYLSSVLNDGSKPDSVSLWIWNSEKDLLVGGIPAAGTIERWSVPKINVLEWSRDGKRLFFGMKPESEVIEEEDKSDEDVDLYDVDDILENREVDVWHWNDPFINSNQKKRWKDEKDRFYRAVYHLNTDRVVLLADEMMPDVAVPKNARFALGSSDVAYRKLVSWDGWYSDYYVVDLEDGSRKKIVDKLRRTRVQLSSEGRYIVYYREPHWYLYDVAKESTRNLTESLKIPFSDEDHDYPQPASGYGIAGWLEGDEAVLVYDKYDIWMFDTDTGSPLNVTDGYGRKNGYTFRIQRLNEDQDFFKEGERLLLSAYQNDLKHTGIYSCTLGQPGVEKIVQKKKKYTLLAQAKDADTILFTRESYVEFPDLWVGDVELRSRKKITDVNPQMDMFAWGDAELVAWESVDGIPLQGVLIKPGNVQKGKRYPVLVYFYRIFSNRLYDFNQVVVNHRPCFPFYASNGYAIFLPDVRFEVGRPGFSATKCIVPGVQKLVDMGIADPDAVALHGHSWSGYQTAFIVTQTDIFKCAIAGAPVSNMTSAYSGIRWGTGLARQFQYEQSQSRIGGTLWNTLPRYIENSPVFYADRINTPLLIMFGDEDGAVPWYQGIELYLAMRRLEKDCVFLQYRGEPHHPQKYPNKLDYTLKMKEYLDYHCKGAEPAEWITKGVPYTGDE